LKISATAVVHAWSSRPYATAGLFVGLLLQSSLVLAQPYLFERRFGLNQFSQAADVAIDSHGHVIVVDTGLSRYFVCDDDGNCDSFGGTGDATGQFFNPVAVDVASDNSIYIVDQGNNRVQVCDHAGDCSVFDVSGAPAAFFPFNPSGIALDSQNRVIISDGNNSRILVCPKAGGNCTAFGEGGQAVGQFTYPGSLSVDAKDRIFVIDVGFGRIQVCDRFGACKAFGLTGEGQWHFLSATYIEWLSSGVFTVVENSQKVSICTERGVCRDLAQANPVSFSDANPQFPQGMTEGSDGSLFLADGNSVRIFQPNVTINPAMSVGVYNSATSGQGVFFDVFQELGIFFGAWFTFDTERPPGNVNAILGEEGHRWLTLQGTFAGNVATVNVFRTRGGVFDSSDPPVEKPSVDVGDATITWDDCGHVTLEYDLTDPPVSGVIHMQRLSGDAIPLCVVLSGDP